MKLLPGYRIELMASEPLVLDPVAFEWDASGRLWVAEMADYPLGLDGNGQHGGRIRWLEDRDNDGRYDHSTVFLDGLSFPNGVMPWRDGVLISATPDILFARDTNGDGKADETRVLFTGFHEGNQQHRMNGFEYGLDNWVDRKSTRLNSSHALISYAVFCLKKKKQRQQQQHQPQQQ